MKVKRFIATFLAVALVFAMAACSATADNSTSSKPSSNTTSEAPKESTSVASKDDDSSTKDEATTPAEDEDTTAPEEDSSEAEDGPKTPRPAKTAEDPVFEKDIEELMTYVAKSVSEEYLVPNEIDVETFVWPTDEASWNYYCLLLNGVYTRVAIGANPEPISEDAIPDSPNKEIMEAVSQGVENWLNEFESCESGYLDHLYLLLKDSEYFLEHATFDSIDPEASPEPDAK